MIASFMLFFVKLSPCQGPLLKPALQEHQSEVVSLIGVKIWIS